MKTGDPELMRELNRFHILDTIRRYGAISRVEISSRSELSSTTVSAVTGALIEDGIIEPLPVGGIREATRGRPRVMLQLNPAAARVVGVKVGPHQIVVAVTDFRGDVLASVDLPLRVPRQPVSVVADLIEDAARRAVCDAGLSMQEIDNLCATLPGVVEHSTGLVRSSPIFGTPDVWFGQELERRLGVRTILDCDANAATLALHWFGSCRELSDFVSVSLEQAIGLSVLHDGALFRGGRGLSLDFGRTVVGAAAAGPLQRLVDLASEPAVVSGLDPEGVGDAAIVGRGLRRATAALEGGDRRARDLIAQVGRLIGVAIANVAYLFAPPRIVLLGSLLALGAPFTEAIRRGFGEALSGPLADVTELHVEPTPDLFWARGAAALALRDLYGSPWGTTGPVRRG